MVCLVPWPRINPRPLHWDRGVSATGPGGSPINLISEGRCGSPRNWFKVLSSNILPNSLITSYAGLENRSYGNPCTPRSFFWSCEPSEAPCVGSSWGFPLVSTAPSWGNSGQGWFYCSPLMSGMFLLPFITLRVSVMGSKKQVGGKLHSSNRKEASGSQNNCLSTKQKWSGCFLRAYIMPDTVLSTLCHIFVTRANWGIYCPPTRKLRCGEG